jgi:outer membrane protein assembly factor BamB
MNSQTTLLWKVKTSAEIHSSPVIDGNILYVGSGDSCFYAMEKTTGEQIWKFKTNGKIHSTPVVKDQQVFLVSGDGYVYALNKSKGTLTWKFKTNSESPYDLWDYYLSSPAVYENKVIVGSGDSTVYALNAQNGKTEWTFPTKGKVHATPLILNDVVYIGSFDGHFYALNARNGHLNWKFKTVGDQYFPKGEIQKGAAFNQSIIFGSRDYNIYALNPKTGTGMWNMKEQGSWIIATPLVYNGNLYFGTSDSHRFYCMDASSGKVKWEIPLNMRVYGSASVVDGHIVFGCFNGKLYFVNAETGAIVTTYQPEEIKSYYSTIYDASEHFRSDFELYGADYLNSEKRIMKLGAILSTPLVENNIVYWGDANGYVYALKWK